MERMMIMTVREWMMLLTVLFIAFGIGYIAADKKHTSESWIDIFFD